MSIHIGAEKGEIADKILLPGDPLRAKYIAENYFEECKKYNDVRGMYGYTGYYKGEKVSVQGTGMGLPSISIYITELIKEYDVKKLVRIGTCGSFQEDIELRDIIIPMSASTNSNLPKKIVGFDNFSPTPSYRLFKNATDEAEKMGVPIKSGNILSSDFFYSENEDYPNPWDQFNTLAVEMESYALFTLAAKYNVEALSILTVSDSLLTYESITAEEKEQSLDTMIKIGLNSIIK